VADKDIFGHVQIGENHRFLVDGGDAVHLGLGGVVHLDGAAIQQHLAAVRLVNAGHDLDEGGFSGPVFAEQRVHLAGIEREGDIIQRLGRVEPLGKPANLEHRSGHHKLFRGQ